MTILYFLWYHITWYHIDIKANMVLVKILQMKLAPSLTNSEIYFYQLWKSQLELELNEAIKVNDIQVIKNSERRLKDLNKNFSY